MTEKDKIVPLTVPKWGLTMEEGTISTWLLEEGDEVEVEDEILEIATDKISQPVESPVAGVLRRIIGEEGEDYPVQALIGIITTDEVTEEEVDAFIEAYEGPVSSADDDDDDEEAADEQVAADHLTAKPLSKMRAQVGKTVTASWQIPQFPVTMAIDMGAATALRAELKADGQSLSMNDVVTRACAKAIEKYPMVNARLEDKEYILDTHINIAIAVAFEDNLMMPVIPNCESLSLTELAETSRRLIGMVKDGSISDAELSGGNFSISNLGMLGVEQFAALIPPGMAAILAVGGIQNEVVVDNGEIAQAAIMRVTLVSDHRVVDGFCAANFLVELKRLLEHPEEL